MMRQRGYGWVSQDDTLLSLSDAASRLYATVLTSLIGEGAREVAAARTRGQANKIIGAVLEYVRLRTVRGPWQPEGNRGQGCYRVEHADSQAPGARMPARG